MTNPLQVHFDSHDADHCFMPGEEVKGWISCRSTCFHPGSASGLKSIRVSLIGECCASVQNSRNITICDSDEIMEQNATLYSSNNVLQQESLLTMKEFVKLPFVLRIADDTSANIATVGSQTGRIPLPPSFKASRVKEFQYIKYFISAMGLRTDGGQPFIHKKDITVLPWDPETRAPAFHLPRLLSADPYVLRAPSSHWKIVSHWLPIKTKICYRREFFGSPIPRKRALVTQSADCSQCHRRIIGPRFICCQCLPDFNWCWSCMSDPNKTHAIEHAFVQIDTSRDPVDYQQRNDAARSAASKHGLSSAATNDLLKSSVGEIRTPGASISDSSSTGLMRMATKYWRHSRSPPTVRTEGKKVSDIKESMSVPANTDNANNVVIIVAAEVDYEFRIPDRATYPQQVSIPLMMRIHVSSVSESDLSELQPILPWSANPSDATTYDGTNGPALWLDLHLESLVENQTRAEKWWGLHWRNMGGYLKPETPRDNAQWAFSHDWTVPFQNETGKWSQSAVVCSWFKFTPYGESPIDLRILKSHFELSMKHRAGGENVKVVLSRMPWTSGRYRSASSPPNANDVCVTSDLLRLHGTESSVTHNLEPSSPTQGPPPPYISQSVAT